MKRETIKRIGKIVYMKLFDRNGNIDINKYQCYRGKNGKDYECFNIFWRIYKII